MCLKCARLGGRQPACAVCASIAPAPRYRIVQDIIGRVAQEHRLAQLAAEAQQAKDFAASRNIEREMLDAQIRCTRRRKRHAEMVKAIQESKEAS